MRIFTGILFLFVTSLASAEIAFSPSFSYITEKDENSGVISEDNMTFFDFRLGYVHESGLFLGAMYSMANYSDATNSNRGFSVGPTLGFSHHTGFL